MPLAPLSISSEGSGADRRRAGDECAAAATTRCATATARAISYSGWRSCCPSGQVWNGLRRLHKDKHRLLPAPAVCRQRGDARHHHRRDLETAFPRPREVEVALCAVVSPGGGALQLFQACQQVMTRRRSRPSNTCRRRAGMALVERFIPDARPPLGAPAAHYVLVELATPRQGAGLRVALEELLAAAMKKGIVADAVIAVKWCAARGDLEARARSIPRRRSAPAPRSRTTSRCRCRACPS